MDATPETEPQPPPSRTAAHSPREMVSGYFRHRVVYPWELPTIMRKHIYTGAMGNIYFTLITGIFFIYYGTELGMSRFEWGLMGGISSFLLTAQIFSAAATERLGHRKLLWFAAALASRLVRIAGVFGSLILWHMGMPHVELVLIGAVCLSNFFEALAAPPWMSWLADIIPARNHGGFWGRRSAWIAFSVVCVIVPAGLLMDHVGQDRKVTVAVAIFAFAAALGVLDLFIHGTLPEPKLAPADPAPLRRRLLAPLRDRVFRPWLVFNGAWTFAMTLGGSLSMLYFLEELGIKRNFLGGTIVLASLPLVGGIMSAAWSGRLVDRIGPKRVLQWGHFFWAMLPFFWLVATPGIALFILAWSSIHGGMSSTAAVNAANKLITRLPRPQERAMYVAVSSCIGNIAGGLGVITAGTTLKIFGDWQWNMMGKTVCAFHLIFLASFLFRMTSARLLIPGIKDLPAEAPLSAGQLDQAPAAAVEDV